MERLLYQQVPQKAKKLVALLAISMLFTEKKTEEELKQVFYILYPVIFKNQTEALPDSESKINTMN